MLWFALIIVTYYASLWAFVNIVSCELTIEKALLAKYSSCSIKGEIYILILVLETIHKWPHVLCILTSKRVLHSGY